MSELLGNKLSIDNLHKDVKNISSVVSSVISRVGNVTWPSWKFPDQASGDVDVHELLTLYEYDEEFPEENNLAHIMLLELVIDRMVLFIQCMTRCMESQMVPQSTRVQSAQDSLGSSLGNITKKCWSKLLQVQSSHQQLNSDVKSHQRKIKDLQEFSLELQDDLRKYHEGTTVANHSSRSQNGGGTTLPPINPSFPKESISKDNSNKSSQTLETAFVPCESCHKVQNSLKGVAKSMVQICKNQGLQSSIAKYMKQLKGVDWYSANDMMRWETEQIKDCDRINSHLTDLMSTIDPLKEQLRDSIECCRRLENRVSACQKEIDLEKESQSILHRQHGQKVEALNTRHEEALGDLEMKRAAIKSEKEQIEKRLKETKHEYELQKSKCAELDEIKQQLMAELEESKTNNAEVKRLESILNSLEQELTTTKEELISKETELSRELAVSKSLTKRTESLQNKYDSLLKRVEEMDDENTALQAEMSTLEERDEELQSALDNYNNSDQFGEKAQTVIERIDKEKKSLQEIIHHLDNKVASLEKELQHAKEQERLLVEYPDLNGPVNSDMTGTGDIATDMINQVKANESRIELLNQQNSSMKATIEKIQRRASNVQPKTAYTSVEPSQPRQLWSQGESIPSLDEHGIGREKIASSEHSPAPSHTGGRPKSGKRGDNSMSAYLKLKKSGLMDKPTPYKQQQESRGGSHCCPNCDKLYHNFDDLKLHQSYCTKR